MISKTNAVLLSGKLKAKKAFPIWKTTLHFLYGPSILVRSSKKVYLN